MCSVTRICYLVPWQTEVALVEGSNLMQTGVRTNVKCAWPLLLHVNHILVVVNYWIGSRFGRDKSTGFRQCASTLVELFRVFGERLQAIESQVCGVDTAPA